MPDKKPHIFIIADFGNGDPAFVEVTQWIKGLIPGVSVDKIFAQSFSTTHTGFWIYQLSLNYNEIKKALGGDVVRNTYIFANTAPRRDKLEPRKDNEGERLVYAKLTGGLEIVGVLSGETFSFVKPLIEKLHVINVPNLGSQFRSRDIYPRTLAQIVNGDYSCLGEKIDISKIPEPAGYKIAHVDGHGNIKTTIRMSDVKKLKLGENVTISINQISADAVYTDGIFGVREGVICFAPGSSGPKENRFMEISKRLGSAWMSFGKPKIETEIKCKFL